jgi:hypothetical protein
MKKIILIWFLVMVSVAAYTQNKPTHIFKINSFTGLPKEIDGCSSYFFLSKNDKKTERYLFVNDLAQLSFIKIDNKLVKFTLVKNYKIGKVDVFLYKSGSMTLQIELKTQKSIEDQTEVTGIMTVQFPTGQKETLNFIGDIGC